MATRCFSACGARDGGRGTCAQVRAEGTSVTALLSSRPGNDLKAVAAGSSPIAGRRRRGKQRCHADWRALLSYYAATQRQDPRGKVDERADEHAVSWQLFLADGSWWTQGELHCLLDALPDTFREALMRRPDTVCSIGYPVGLFVQSGVPSFVPGLLLPAVYRLTASHLIVEITEAEPVINPIWLDLVVGRSRWRKEALVDALLLSDDAGDLADITNRIAQRACNYRRQPAATGPTRSPITLGAEGLRECGRILSAIGRPLYPRCAGR